MIKLKDLLFETSITGQQANTESLGGYKGFVKKEEFENYKRHLAKTLRVELVEGVNDPGILKAVFLAGGPGSGKTYIAKGLFGIPDKVNVSQTGMKMVNSDKELKYLLKKFGFGTDLDSLPDEVFRNLTDPTDPKYSGLRDFAKDLTGERKKQYMNGRLGMIIDGTGDDFRKISSEKKELEAIGYDCYMIFVNTSLEVALQRNENRDRILPEKIVRDSHRAVTQNLGGFQGLFGGSNFLIVDNNEHVDEEKAQKRFNMLVKQGIGKFVKTPLKNKRGLSWVRKNKILKGKK
jgi:predicted kinase|tara:strand:+ start:141 stop:1013 length:873 start_codon:yes stop_codon:yes gene_type:complete